jgi:hypothetical protein
MAALVTAPTASAEPPTGSSSGSADIACWIQNFLRFDRGPIPCP